MRAQDAIRRGTVLDLNVSRFRHRDAISERSPIFGDSPPWGFVYTCPRCGWTPERGKKHRLGAEYEGDKHALVCAP